MPRSHKRSQDVAALLEVVDPIKLKRHDALKILASEQRDLLVDAINRFAGVTTYAAAVRVVTTEPCYQLLCETCGWTLDMICPECPGCGCHNDTCTGWRHHEYADDSSDDDPEYWSDEDGPEYDGEDEWQDSYEVPETTGRFEEDLDYGDDDHIPPKEEPDEPNWPDDQEPMTSGGWGGSTYPAEPPF